MSNRSGFLEGPTAPNDGPQAFIQWKGTDVCLDFTCTCGANRHFDGDFAYVLKCPDCGARWEMPCLVYPRPAAPEAGPERMLALDDEKA